MRMTFSHPLPKKALTNFENLVAARRNQLGNNNNNNSSTNNNSTVRSEASGLKQNSSISSAISPSSSSSAAQPLKAGAASYGVMKKNATGRILLYHRQTRTNGWGGFGVLLSRHVGVELLFSNTINLSNIYIRNIVLNALKRLFFRLLTKSALK